MTTRSKENTAALERLLSESYGLSGNLERLLGERDRNYRLSVDGGERYVVKVVDPDESEAVSDFQIQALLHMQEKACPLLLPGIVALKSGEYSAMLDENGNCHIVRVVTYLPGTPMTEIDPDERLARELGAALAKVDLALADFEHNCERRDLVWDMQNAGRLRERIEQIPGERVRNRVRTCLDDFKHRVEPRFGSLRTQVIHSDLNPANVLVGGRPAGVVGIIDFSDMVRAPLIIDVAIGASYLRSESSDALELIAPFVAGFNDVTPLQREELGLLYDLVRTRLATTITMKYWRASVVSGDDTYLQQAMQEESGAESFLARLDAMSGQQFGERIHTACGRRDERKN